MKTSMMDLQTSTLTLSFWNMSKNGRKRSWKTERSGERCGTTKVTDYSRPPECKRFIVCILKRWLLTMEKRTEKSWK